MNLQRMIKIVGGISSSAVLLLGLNGCTETGPVSPNNTSTSPSASFTSSTVCANNAFLQKYQCSFPRVEQAARAGDPDAQYALGYLYYYGIGTTQDRQTGLMWIRKAAAQGQPVAQEALKTLSVKQTAKPKSSSVSSSSTPSSSSSSSSSSANGSVGGTQASTNSQAQPDKPLTDYLPNYGEKRINTTATPPSVDLSTPPATQN